MSGPSGGSSSCRPDRLFAFAQLAVGMAEGMGDRIRAVQAAIPAYLDGCDKSYVVDVSGVPTGLGGWGIKLHDLGDWTRGVASGFLRMDGVALYTGAGINDDNVMTLPDSKIIANMPGRFQHDPYLGMQASEATPFDWAKNGSVAEEMVQALAKASPATAGGMDLTGGAAVKTSLDFNEALAEVGVDVEEPKGGPLATIDLADWSLAAASVVVGFAQQWKGGAGFSEGARFLESVAAGGVDGIASVMGLATTVAATPELGPLAPVAGLAVAGGLTVLGNLALGSLLPKPNLSDPRVMASYTPVIDAKVGAGTVQASTSQAVGQSALDQASASTTDPALQRLILADAQPSPGPPGQYNYDNFPSVSWNPQYDSTDPSSPESPGHPN